MSTKNITLIGLALTLVLVSAVTAGCVSNSYTLNGLWSSSENPDYDADLYVEGELGLLTLYSKSGEKIVSDVVNINRIDGTHYQMGQTVLEILNENYLELYFTDGRHYMYRKQA